MITKEEIDDMVWNTLKTEHDGFIYGRSEVVEQTWSKIESLQKENTELKRKLEISEIEHKIIRVNQVISVHENPDYMGKGIFYKDVIKTLSELEARLAELKG